MSRLGRNRKKVPSGPSPGWTRSQIPRFVPGGSAYGGRLFPSSLLAVAFDQLTEGFQSHAIQLRTLAEPIINDRRIHHDLLAHSLGDGEGLIDFLIHNPSKKRHQQSREEIRNLIIEP